MKMSNQTTALIFRMAMSISAGSRIVIKYSAKRFQSIINMNLVSSMVRSIKTVEGSLLRGLSGHHGPLAQSLVAVGPKKECEPVKVWF